MTARLKPEFIEGSAGRLLVTCFVPTGDACRWLLFLPPFAEEMNKSRRMMARLGYALASEGVGLCLPDLYGTGDSAGNFADADLQTWLDDSLAVAVWLERRHRYERLELGGLRFGALLAMQLREALPGASACLLWQPVHKGQQQLTGLLRLRQAAGLMGSGPRESLAELQALLAGGEVLEVAGYGLSPVMAAGLAAAELSAHAPPAGCPIAWLELSNNPERPLMPLSRQVIEQWRGAGSDVRARSVPGDAFWSTQELVDASALVTASLEAMSELQA